MLKFKPGDKVKIRGSETTEEVAYIMPKGKEHPAYMVVKSGEWAWLKEVEAAEVREMNEMITQSCNGGIWIHNFLKYPERITTQIIGEGLRTFDIKGSGQIMDQDFIIKLSDDGKQKTVWHVTDVVVAGDRHFKGTIRDVLHHKEMTEDLKKAVRESDRV